VKPIDHLDADLVAHEPVRHLAQEDLVGRGELLEARRSVQGVRRQRAHPDGGRRHEHLTGIHANAQRQRCPSAQLERGPHRP
jgi:hypothetical protein